MSRHCPRCAAKLSPSVFLLPKFMRSPTCPSCKSQIEYAGVFSWGIEIGYLLISYGIYRLIEGNLSQALVVIPIAIVFMIFEYHFARIKIAGTR